VVADKTLFESELQNAVANAGICCSSATIYFDAGSGAYDSLVTDELSLSGYTFRKLYIESFSFTMEDDSGLSSYRWDDQ
jgi:hypothetical protein